MIENFSELMSDVKPDSGSSEIPRKINAKKSIPGHIIFTLQRIKYKEKIFKETSRKKYLSYREARSELYLTSLQKFCRKKIVELKYLGVSTLVLRVDDLASLWWHSIDPWPSVVS